MDTRPGKPFALRIRFEGIASRVGITEERQQDYLIRGQARETLHSDGLTGVNLAGRIRVVTDGYHHLEESGIWVENATRATLLVDLETDMFQPDPEETAGRGGGGEGKGKKKKGGTGGGRGEGGGEKGEVWCGFSFVGTETRV